MSDSKYVLILTAEQRDHLAEALAAQMAATALPVAFVMGDDLDTLREHLADAAEARVCIEGGVKVSTDRRRWTPSLGETSRQESGEVDAETLLKCAALRRGILNLKADGASLMLAATVK